jgi:hypothetical protein
MFFVISAPVVYTTGYGYNGPAGPEKEKHLLKKIR